MNNSSNSTNYRLNYGFVLHKIRNLKISGSSIREANTKTKSIPEPTALA
jgi:hypothetical protein